MFSLIWFVCVVLFCSGMFGKGGHNSKGFQCRHVVAVGSKELLVYIAAESLGCPAACLLWSWIETTSNIKVVGSSLHCLWIFSVLCTLVNEPTVKSRVQYALVYNTQDDFSLLSMGRIKVHVYYTHWLLLKSFQWRASGLHRFDQHTPLSSQCQHQCGWSR